MATKNKKISLNYIIESLNEVSGASLNDFMGDSDSHASCIKKALEFLIALDLLNSSKINFNTKTTDNEVV